MTKRDKEDRPHEDGLTKHKVELRYGKLGRKTATVFSSTPMRAAIALLNTLGLDWIEENIANHMLKAPNALVVVHNTEDRFGTPIKFERVYTEARRIEQEMIEIGKELYAEIEEEALRGWVHHQIQAQYGEAAA
jgi:hypothetical protein